VGDDVEGTMNGGANVAKNGSFNWNGLRVVNDDPIDNDATTMSFQDHQFSGLKRNCGH
jgi:hypothetical protein